MARAAEGGDASASGVNSGLFKEGSKGEKYEWIMGVEGGEGRYRDQPPSRIF